LDSIGIKTGTGWRFDSGYVNIPVTSITGAPDTMVIRFAIPQDTVGSSYGYGINWSTTDGDSNGATWDYWDGDAGTPVTWNVGGADSVASDYWYSDLDTVPITLVANTIARIDVTGFINRIIAASGDYKNAYNGMILLFPTAEDGTEANNVTVGNVQPFAGSDSIWFDFYGTDVATTASEIQCESPFTRCIMFSDTSDGVVLTEIDRDISVSTDGATRLSVQSLNDYSDAWYTNVVFSMTDTAIIRNQFPPDSFRIDSALLKIYVLGKKFADYLHIMPLLRTARDSVTMDRLGHWIGRTSDGRFASTNGEIATCYSYSSHRIQDPGASCDSSALTWDGNGADISGQDYDPSDSTNVALLGAGYIYYDVDVLGIVRRWQNTHADSVLGKGMLIHIDGRAGKNAMVTVANVTPWASTSDVATKLMVYAVDTTTAAGAAGRRRRILIGENNGSNHNTEDRLCSRGSGSVHRGSAETSWDDRENCGQLQDIFSWRGLRQNYD